MKMVLFDELEPVSDRLRSLNDATDGADFAARLLVMRRDAFTKLPDGVDSPEAALAAERMAHLALRELRKIPLLGNVLSEQLRDEEVSPGLRCATAFALAYLVSPIDLLHDDLPGGYGYVDDAIMLWAILGATNQARLGGEERYLTALDSIKVLNMSLPRNLADVLGTAAADAINTVKSLESVPEAALVAVTGRYVEYPAEAIIQAVNKLGKTSAPSAPTSGESPFSLPGGGVGLAKDGTLTYEFDGGDVIALT